MARIRSTGPALSVVVVVTDDNARFLDECVAALDAQSRPPDEVLLVVIGEQPGTSRAAASCARARWRVRRLDRPRLPRGEAVAEGARASAGPLLMFGDAGEVLDPGALDELVSALAGDPAAELAGGSRADLGGLVLGDLVLRRALWQRVSVTVTDAPYAEWLAAARLVLAARRVADVPRRRRTGDRRGTGVAFATMPVRAPFVKGWWAAVLEVSAALAGEERDRFHRWVGSQDAVGYAEDVERCTPAQWDELAEAADSFLRSAADDVVDDLPVEARVRLWLAARRRRADLAGFCADRWLDEGQFPTTVHDGRAYAELAVPGEPLPPSLLALGPTETCLEVHLRRMRWAGPDTVELELFVFVRHVGWDSGPASHSVRLLGPGGVCPAVTRCAVDAEVNLVSGDRFADHSAGVLHSQVDADLLLAGVTPGEGWRVEVESSVAGVVRRGAIDDVDLRSSAAALPPHPGTGRTLRPRRSVEGWALVVSTPDPAPRGWQVTDALLAAGELVVRGHAGGPSGRLDLRGAVAGPSVEVRVHGEEFEAILPLTHEPWQLGPRPLPAGTYRFHVATAGSPPVRLPAAPALAAATPSWQRSDLHRMRLQRGLDGALLVTLAAPLAADEIGPLAQQRLQSAYATVEHRLDPSAVYLQSYTGQVATDSPLAIHHELRRQRPDLSLHWSVADSSTVVPEGGRALVQRSREWYDALATCGHLVTNIDMERWFRKRPGQRLLQTYHGYPAKTMGLSAWEAKNFTPLRIERLLRRTSGTWDLLLTPTPAMDVHYRREYLYDGPILAAGYPRDDVLVGADAPAVRDATRRRLGIADRQRAVLYAPTWRDDLATNFRAAAMSTAFDVQSAAAELGGDYVILLRGHRFHRRRDAAGASLLDVTDYPEINDLVLAADVAVLDYSSLRFDFALTGRPMVFLVPDLHRYTQGVRGFLFDFAGSAPGPLLETTADVVAALADLDSLGRSYSEERARFGEEFNSRQDGRAAERVVRAFFGGVSA